MTRIIQDYPWIYKRDSKGLVRVWKMELGYNDDTDTAAHRVIAGIKDGKLVTSGWNECQGKNLGKKNATTSLTQAQSEIESLYEKKLELAYFSDVDDVDNERFFDPMLAHIFEKYEHRFDITKGVFAQPKLDGIRCIANRGGLWTRKGKRIVACPHVEAACEHFFNRNPEAVLDGELYNHYLAEEFQKIVSIVRKTKPTGADLARAENLIQFHVYDWVSDKPYRERLAGVQDAVRSIDSPHVVPVETVLVSSNDHLDETFTHWLGEKYEGQMVRLDGQPYQVGKRSPYLLKRKQFDTDEFPVLAMEEGSGNWSGAIKRLIVLLPNGKDCETGIAGSYDLLSEMLQKGHKPDWATVRYHGYTDEGKLRIPVAIDWGFGQGRTD